MLEFFIKYLQFEKRSSAHTIIAYKNDISQFWEFCFEKYCLASFQEVRHFHIRSWVVELMQIHKIEPRSIRRKISALKAYFKFLHLRGELAENPCTKLVLPKMGKSLPEFIPEQRLDLLFLEENFSDDFSGFRDRVILEVLYATGMRRSELIQLELINYSTYGKYFKILGKGKKERIVPIAPYLVTILDKYFKKRSEKFPNSMSQYLFLTNKGEVMYDKLVYNLVRKYLSLVSTSDKKSPHTLRHSFATHLTDNGADLNAVKELLGHSSLAATQIYSHNSVEKLKKVYELAHPKSKKT